VPGDGTNTQCHKCKEQQTAEKVAQIQKKIDEQNEKKQMETRVRGMTELNHITKYAVNLTKEKKPKDTLDFLRRTDKTPEIGSRKSSEMAEIAKSYHEDLQKDGMDVPSEARERALEDALGTLPTPYQGPEMNDLNKKLTEADISQSVKGATADRAAGINGLISEFWQELGRMYSEAQKSDEETGKKRGNIIKVLTWVYNDIEEYGVIEDTGFALGWMCPIFKKKDATDIANYRPITVLNTDYKIFTKVLANKLTEVAPHLIHKDQSGFMRGRKITNAIYLTMEVVDYSEDDIQNGIIVALDQEKAYDKTLHSYLWETLRRHGLPELFISTIKSLYEFAETHVVINGEPSSAFRVTRGVRQGDPLSCLLFNLAIEPLAVMLRSSGLQGYSIPEVARMPLSNYLRMIQPCT
jgi:hypothetical protein